MIYGSKPKTSSMFESQNINAGKNIEKRSDKVMIGDLKNRRALAMLTESNLHDIPVNYSLKNMKTEQFCFELL